MNILLQLQNIQNEKYGHAPMSVFNMTLFGDDQQSQNVQRWVNNLTHINGLMDNYISHKESANPAELQQEFARIQSEKEKLETLATAGKESLHNLAVNADAVTKPKIQEYIEHITQLQTTMQQKEQQMR